MLRGSYLGSYQFLAFPKVSATAPSRRYMFISCPIRLRCQKPCLVFLPLGNDQVTQLRQQA